MTMTFTFTCEVCGNTAATENPQYVPGWVFVQVERSIHHTCSRACGIKLLERE